MENTEVIQTFFEPSAPQEEVYYSRESFTLAMFGQGSGKTHLMGEISGNFINLFPKVTGFIGANTYTQLTQSTLRRIRKVWAEAFHWTEYNAKSNQKGQYVVGLKPPAHFETEGHDVDNYNNTISFVWGTLLFVGSLDNYKAHDGKEFAWALLDETKDTREEALKEVIMGRLRESGMYVDTHGNLCHDTGEEPFNPLYIFSTPAKIPWLNEFFNLEPFYDQIMAEAISETDYFCEITREGMRAVIASSYHNAKNLPKGWIEKQKTGRSTAENNRLIYAIPFSKSGGECYKDFDMQKNSADLRWEYDRTEPLFLSFDFNVLPYMTCKVYQIHKEGVRYTVFGIDEVCLKPPRNSTRAVCREILGRYPDHEGGVFVTGDPSGMARDTRSEEGGNDFTIIANELSVYHPEVRVSAAAPRVVPRIQFANAIFRGESIITYIESKDNVYSLRDFMYVKEDADGKKLKEKVKDKETGQTYEKYGHCSDAHDYFMCKFFPAEFRKYSGKKKPQQSTSKAG